VGFSLSTSHKSANGVSVVTSAESQIAQSNKQVPLVASVRPSFTFAEHDLTANFALNQKVAKTSERFRLASLEAGVEKANPFGIKGANVGGGLVYKQKEENHAWLVKANLDFSNHFLATKVDAEYEVNKGVTDGSFSFAATHSNVSLGVFWNNTPEAPPEGSGPPSDDIPRCGGGVAYHQDKYSLQANASIFATKRYVDIDVWHQCSDKDAWTLNIDGKLNEKNTYQRAKVGLSTRHEFDDDTNVKAQVCAKFAEAKQVRLNVAFSRKVTPNVTTTVGANINALQVFKSAPGKPHSFGLQVEIE